MIFFKKLHTLKFSWTQNWNHLLKTQHICGTAQSCLFIQKQSSCSIYMLLSQCIWKFHFNCFFTPVMRGLRQLLPCILFSVPGDIPHYTMCHPTSRVLVSATELTWRKSVLCMKWWPQLWDFATPDFSFIFQLLGYYLLCCETLRSGCCRNLNYLQMRKLWNTKL